jgi:hypothetical protein
VPLAGGRRRQVRRQVLQGLRRRLLLLLLLVVVWRRFRLLQLLRLRLMLLRYRLRLRLFFFLFDAVDLRLDHVFQRRLVRRPAMDLKQRCQCLHVLRGKAAAGHGRHAP